MRVFRLTRKKYSNDFNGFGAAKYGYRWNSKGTEIIYTAESRALAMAEVIVHLSLSSLPRNYVMMEIDIPASVKIEILLAGLDTNWNMVPGVVSTQKFGDAFVNSNTSSVLKVPSAVVQGDYNYLINPKHKDFIKIKVVEEVSFPFDKRIFQIIN